MSVFQQGNMSYHLLLGPIPQKVLLHLSHIHLSMLLSSEYEVEKCCQPQKFYYAQRNHQITGPNVHEFEIYNEKFYLTSFHTFPCAKRG